MYLACVNVALCRGYVSEDLMGFHEWLQVRTGRQSRAVTYPAAVTVRCVAHV